MLKFGVDISGKEVYYDKMLREKETVSTARYF